MFILIRCRLKARARKGHLARSLMLRELELNKFLLKADSSLAKLFIQKNRHVRRNSMP